MMKKIFGLLLLMTLPVVSVAGDLSFGVQYQMWDLNSSRPNNGSEIWVPASMVLNLNDDIKLYGQGMFGNGNYTDSTTGLTQTQNLTSFSDAILGSELHFKSFGLPAILNIAFNVPTGDPSWELKQFQANIPTEFVDSRYRGRGFGVNAMYGISVPSGGGEYGLALGYSYSGAFNPNYGAGIAIDQLKLGDSAFFSLNHFQPFTGDQSEVIRLSVFQGLPTQQNGQNVLQLGMNFNASYGWTNPKGLSFEVGGQAWLPSQVSNNGQWGTEPKLSLGPRFYLNPSYSFGDLSIAGRFKYILQNGYDASQVGLYDGGGFLLGIEPSYTVKLGTDSALRFFGSYDYILNVNTDLNTGQAANFYYNHFTFGTNYQIKL